MGHRVLFRGVKEIKEERRKRGGGQDERGRDDERAGGPSGTWDGGERNTREGDGEGGRGRKKPEKMGLAEREQIQLIRRGRGREWKDR